jgi:hypothetical protein
MSRRPESMFPLIRAVGTAIAIGVGIVGGTEAVACVAGVGSPVQPTWRSSSSE